MGERSQFSPFFEHTFATERNLLPIIPIEVCTNKMYRGKTYLNAMNGRSPNDSQNTPKPEREDLPNPEAPDRSTAQRPVNMPFALEAEFEAAAPRLGVPPSTTVGQVLSGDEIADLNSCERVISCGLRSFFSVGQAFVAIKENRLYRETHPTFESYCLERWKMSVRRAYQLCDAVEIIKSLGFGTNGKATGGQTSNVNHGTQLIPPTERHARALVNLSLRQRREAWRRAVELADGAIPSVADVQSAVEWVKSNPERSTASKEETFVIAAIQHQKALVHIRKAISHICEAAVFLESIHVPISPKLTKIAKHLEGLLGELEIRPKGGLMKTPLSKSRDLNPSPFSKPKHRSI